MKRRVVVTGLGAVTSLSSQIDSLWEKILAGHSGVHTLRLFDTTRFKVHFAGDVYDWSPDQNRHVPGGDPTRWERALFAKTAQSLTSSREDIMNELLPFLDNNSSAFDVLERSNWHELIHEDMFPQELQDLLIDIMEGIHDRCVEHGGTAGEAHIDYVRGANIAGFIKVADAMLAYGVV